MLGRLSVKFLLRNLRFSEVPTILDKFYNYDKKCIAIILLEVLIAYDSVLKPLYQRAGDDMSQS